jgi:hypothetical protein
MTRSGLIAPLAALLLLVLGLTPAAAPGAAAQGEQALEFEEVVVGYDGVVRRGHWFPISVTVSNAGPDLQAELVWQDEDVVFRRALDLPRGARKRVTLMALDQRNFRTSGTLVLQAGGQRLAEQQVRLNTIDEDVYAIGVIGDDPALLNSLAALRLPAHWNRTVIAHVSADQLPEQWPALAMLNVLFVGGAGSESWTDTQREALRLWVNLGGQLVIGGGVDADRITAGFGELLPVELGAALIETDLRPLHDLASTAAGGAVAPIEPEQSSVREATARPGARVLVESNGLALLVARPRGAGQEIYAGFELGALRGWADEVELWQAALTSQPILALGASYRRGGDNLLQSVLQLPGLGLPSTWALLLYLVVYVLLVGPANYLLLRRLDRREWAWLTVPATVALFALGTYLLGFGARGGTVLLNQVAVVQSSEGEPAGTATTFVGMFSPRRGSYTMSVPASTLVADLNVFDSSLGDPPAPLVVGEQVLIEDMLVDVGSLRTIVAENATPVPFQVQSSLRDLGATLEGELRIEGAAVQQAMVVLGENAVTLGDLRPGEQKPVRLQLSSNNFPWGAAAATSGTFNRQQIVNSLFSAGRFGPWNSGSWMMNVGAPYLLAWVEQPVVEAQIVDGAAGRNNLTLYVIQLAQPEGP